LSIKLATIKTFLNIISSVKLSHSYVDNYNLRFGSLLLCTHSFYMEAMRKRVISLLTESFVKKLLTFSKKKSDRLII